MLEQIIFGNSLKFAIDLHVDPMIVLRDCQNSTMMEILGGAVVLGIFIAVWVGSLGTPILFFVAIRYQMMWTAATIVVLSIISYLPWNRGMISKVVTGMVDHYHPRYYHSCQNLFHPDAVPSKSRSNKLLYAVHPHGAFCLGWSTLFHAPEISANVRFCFSPALYASPLFRLWCRLTGRPGAADKKSMVRYMRNGEHLALPPGGFEEATLTCMKQDRAYIQKRAGFVKLCLQHGYHIVPVFCFGEKNTFWNMQGGWAVRLALNGLGIPAIAICGLPMLPFIPKRTKLVTVAGRPLACPHLPSPTRDEVSLWHGKYITALQQLYEEHKCTAYGDEDGKTSKLELW